MKSVPSWDDSVFAPVAACVAAVTALLSGHAIYRHDPPVVVHHAPMDTVHTGVDTSYPSGGVVHADTDAGADTDPQPLVILTPPPDRLVDHVLTKEGDVDQMNAQIGDILDEVKLREVHRRK
jgi:hypothetical protein